GTAIHELRVLQCDGCGTLRWPPRPACAACHEMSYHWTPVPPQGALYTWTVVVHQTMKGLTPPYVVGLVEIAPGVRMLGNVVGLDPAELRIGQPLRAVFERVDDAVTLVNWTA